MSDYLVIHRRLEIAGEKTRVRALRVSFVRLPYDDWSKMGRLNWTRWVTVSLTLDGAQTREMIEVTPGTLRDVLDSQLDLVRLIEQEQKSFNHIRRQATTRERRRATAS